MILAALYITVSNLFRVSLGVGSKRPGARTCFIENKPRLILAHSHVVCDTVSLAHAEATQ